MTVHSIGEAFQPFPKIARLARECVVTEKIDGTNAQINILAYGDMGPNGDSVAAADGYEIYAGSRSRWLRPGKATDNFGFAGWVKDNAAELVKLGPGRHYGEWWGKGINRGYGLDEKRFSLFNTGRWVEQPKGNGIAICDGNESFAPACCHVVPVLYSGEFDTEWVNRMLTVLDMDGSYAAPGFDNPEGIIVYHSAANIMFKRTIEDDAAPKSIAQRAAA